MTCQNKEGQCVTPVSYLRYWCQKILPAVYDDSLSYYELLNKVVAKLNDVIAATNEIIDCVNEHGEVLENLCPRVNALETNYNELLEWYTKDNDAIKKLEEELNTLKKDMEAWKNGEYISQYIQALIEYIDENLIKLIGRIVKFVWFGLNQEGRFVAKIPLSWKFLNFDTIMDCNDPRYGHLLLRY